MSVLGMVGLELLLQVVLAAGGFCSWLVVQQRPGQSSATFAESSTCTLGPAESARALWGLCYWPRFEFVCTAMVAQHGQQLTEPRQHRAVCLLNVQAFCAVPATVAAMQQSWAKGMKALPC